MPFMKEINTTLQMPCTAGLLDKASRKISEECGLQWDEVSIFKHGKNIKR